MAREHRWGANPGYTHETGQQPPGKFRQNAQLLREMAEKGIGEGHDMLLYGDQDRYEFVKIEQGSIIARNARTKKLKKIGLNAVERVV